MIRNKLWRTLSASLLAFGWLLFSPISAHSDDPLTVAAQEIEDLKDSIEDLNYKDEFNRLIGLAEDKYDVAYLAKEAQDNAIAAYEDALNIKDTAAETKINAQSAVDGQTATVATALTNKNNAQDDLSIANINLQTAQANMQSAGGSGLQYTVYNLVRTWPSIATPDSVICSGTWNSNSMQLPVCGNRYENIVVKFSGQITVPSWFDTVEFAGYTDDGFKMYIDGELAVNNWVEQGARWSAWSPTYDVTQDKTFDVEIWWYNGGGPGSYHLGWTIPGGMTGAGCDYSGNPRVWGQNFSCNLNTFSSGSGPTATQISAYNNAVAAQQSAQEVYSDKLSIYNQEVQNLTTAQTNLTTAEQNLTTAQTNLTTSLSAKNAAELTYEQSLVNLNNSIDDAWNYYKEQKEREIQIAIAQAAANAAANQPTIEPSPEPSPEQTQQVDPTPEPTPETTHEATPEPTPEPETSPEPEPEPSPQSTDIDQEPTPEPEPTPAEPSEEPQDNPIIQDKELAALIPENGTGTTEDLSGVIANLTSKDNKLVKLSPEQVAAVSQTLKALTQEAKAEIAEDLGISAGEVAKIADQMKSNPAIASAFVEFADRAGDAGDTPMPFTLADAVTEVQTEAFLADPLGALFNVDPLELLSNFSELGSDMTDDQREKAQEVVIPVVIVSQIASTIIGMRR